MKQKPRHFRTVNTRRVRGIIKKRIDRNDGVSLNKMAKSLGVARSSVQLIVKKELGLRSYRLFKGQKLTDFAKAKRLEKCKELLKIFEVRRIEDVLWTDEKIFPIEVAHNSQNDRQLISPSQRYSSERRIVTKSLFPRGVMVWGGITSKSKTPLVFIDQNVRIDAKFYQDEILRKVLVPWKQKNPNMILQQDWAPAHGAETTIAYLEENFPGFLNKNQWPSRSPDLNPIDFSVWGLLEEKLKNKNITKVEQLRRELEQAWSEIGEDYLRRTVVSVKTRLKACIKAKGGHFENFL